MTLAFAIVANTLLAGASLGALVYATVLRRNRARRALALVHVAPARRHAAARLRPRGTPAAVG
jgi:hypothetical protein